MAEENAAAAGGWVFPEEALEEDENTMILTPAEMEFEGNIALRNVFFTMAITVNYIWHRRSTEATVHSLSSHRRETVANRRGLALLRASALFFAEEVASQGGVPIVIPEVIEAAVAELELPAAP